MAKRKTSRSKGKRSDPTKMLSKFKDRWDDDRESAASGMATELEDGRYILKVAGMEFKTSQAGNFGLNTKFTVTTGDSKGSTVYRWDNISEDQGLTNVARHLGVYGHSLDEVDVDDLPELCESIVSDAPTVIADLVTKNDFQNVNIRKLADVEDDGDDGDTVDDEDEVVIFDKGDDVEAKIGKSWKAGIVVSYDDDEDAYVVKVGKKKHTLDAEKVRELSESEGDEDPDDDDEDVEDLEKGTKVQFTAKIEGDKKAKKHTGIVRHCDDGICKIKIDGKKKLLELPVDSLNVLDDPDVSEDDDDDDDEDRAPVKSDIVLVTIKGKEKEGEVLKSSKKKETCLVKVGKKEHTFDWTDVEVQYDDDDDD